MSRLAIATASLVLVSSIPALAGVCDREPDPPPRRAATTKVWISPDANARPFAEVRTWLRTIAWTDEARALAVTDDRTAARLRAAGYFVSDDDTALRCGSVVQGVRGSGKIARPSAPPAGWRLPARAGTLYCVLLESMTSSIVEDASAAVAQIDENLALACDSSSGCFIAATPAQVVRIEQLRQVRWLAPYQPANKISPRVVCPSLGDQASAAKVAEILAAIDRASGKVTFEIVVSGNGDGTDLRAAVEAIAGKAAIIDAIDGVITMRVGPRMLRELARSPSVWRIDARPPPPTLD